VVRTADGSQFKVSREQLEETAKKTGGVAGVALEELHRYRYGEYPGDGPTASLPESVIGDDEDDELQVNYCSACGQELAGDERFCPGCGNEL
jgi:hypothetical protein